MSSILDIYLKGVERRHNQSSGHDRVTPDTIDREAFYQDRSQSSWQERVKIMWVPSDEGDYSPELNMVRTSTIFSGLAGASAGVILKASDARKKFMTQNRHEIFENSLVAERKLLDIMAWTGIKNGFAWGWRCAAMTLIFTGVGTTLITIRNAVNPIDQALAGSILGVVVRLKHGPKAWLSGAAVGGGLGAMAGSYMWVRTYLSGITIEERWSQEFKSIQRQQEEKRKEVEEIQEKVILNKKKWTAQDLEPSVPSSTESALLKIKSLLPGGGKKD